MSNKTLNLTDRLYEYLLSVSLRESDILHQLRQETAELPNANMQISPDQGQFLAFLIELTGSKKTLELGVFTGYSGLVTALALPDDGQIVACDVSKEFTEIARKYWEKAGVAYKFDLRIAPALETLNQLLAEDQAETFDFAFIDADKENYLEYYELVLQLIRPGGTIAIDNVLWSGKVADAEVQDPDTSALRAFNQHVHQDRRVTLTLLTIADGLTLVRKR